LKFNTEKGELSDQKIHCTALSWPRRQGHAQADVVRSYNVSQATISRLEASPFRRRKRRRGMNRNAVGL
jgi:hypothetical protein